MGELGTRLAELEKIRNFLTGEALTTIADNIFSVVYTSNGIAQLLLTLVALIVIPIQVAITVVGAPLFRKQWRAAEENAITQSHPIEVLSGSNSKAQNVEMMQWKWQENILTHCRSFETITGTVGTNRQALQKLSQLLVLWIGAILPYKEVFRTLLIAFWIISGYVTQPLLRLSTIWQRIQELRISFERLADIIDTPQESTEIDKSKTLLPQAEGNVKFENIDFSFTPGSELVLKNINLSVPAGTFVGIVGQSGSGKHSNEAGIKTLPPTGRALLMVTTSKKPNFILFEDKLELFLKNHCYFQEA